MLCTNSYQTCNIGYHNIVYTIYIYRHTISMFNITHSNIRTIPVIHGTIKLLQCHNKHIRSKDLLSFQDSVIVNCATIIIQSQYMDNTCSFKEKTRDYPQNIVKISSCKHASLKCINIQLLLPNKTNQCGFQKNFCQLLPFFQILYESTLTAV